MMLRGRRTDWRWEPLVLEVPVCGAAARQQRMATSAASATRQPHRLASGSTWSSLTRAFGHEYSALDRPQARAADRCAEPSSEDVWSAVAAGHWHAALVAIGHRWKILACACMLGVAVLLYFHLQSGERPDLYEMEPCEENTGGFCRSMPCWDHGGPTVPCNAATEFRCLCRPGYCAVDDGKCCLSTTTLLATVVPVASPGASFPLSHSDVEVAMCFSSGGSRSLSLSLGYLRALEQLNLMTNVDAVSATSGGAWALAVYMFQTKYSTAQELLGGETNPLELTLEQLRQDPPPLGAIATKDLMYLARPSGFLDTVGMMVKEARGADRVWTNIVRAMMLSPFDLNSSEAFVAASVDDVERIRIANPGLRKHPFLTPAPGKPKVFVITGTVLAPDGQQATPETAWPLQMSPDFSGSPFHSPQHGLHDDGAPWSQDVTDVRIGGGFVETFAFGGDQPESQSGGDLVKLPAPAVPFTLADMIGISSAAFAGVVAGAAGDDDGVVNSLLRDMSTITSRADPSVKLWPILEGTESHQNALKYKVGDGAILDVSGVLVMLQRRARKIVWFVNTDMGIANPIADSREPAFFDWCQAQQAGQEEIDPKGKISDQIYDKFGYGELFYQDNQVFPKEDLLEVGCSMQRLKVAGKPVIVQKDHKLLDNKRWGIVGGRSVSVLYVYNEVVGNFYRQLPGDTQQEILRNGEAFAGFPFFKTIFQNGIGHPVALTPTQVNLLAAQAEFSVKATSALFQDFLPARSQSWWRRYVR